MAGFFNNNPEPVDDGQQSVSGLVKEFNRQFSVVNEGGCAAVFRRVFDPVRHRFHFERISFTDFRSLYLNRTVQTGIGKDGKPKYAQAADAWLRNPHRKQYLGGVVFDPTGRFDEGVLNLWHGFGVSPIPGSWQRLKDHLRYVLCAGKVDGYEYVMDWSARLVQFPAEQGEVAIVMRGIEGCGKGLFGNSLRRLLGQHGVAISNSKHLTGNFNGHLRDTVLLFVDEAFYAGDKAHVGILRALVTEAYFILEGKYRDAIECPNYLHIVMASNEDWVVPASLDSRRWLVLDVLPTRAGDLAYFDRIYQELEAGGYEAMLHELLHRDISNFNPRKVPNTAGLEEQRKLSLHIPEQWWHDVLHRGYVFASKPGLEAHFGQWHDEVATEILFASYQAFSKEHRDRHPMSRETFGRFMTNTVKAEARRLSDAVVGEHLADVPNVFGGTTRKAEVVKAARPPGYHLGALGGCRTAFSTETGLTFEWPEEP
jgi:hypothetical protein